MNHRARCVITFQSATLVEAWIQLIGPDRIEKGINRKWWNECCLKRTFSPVPIDLEWKWGEDEVVIYAGREIKCATYGLITGDGYVQGAMLISVQSVPSSLPECPRALFVERLFTAPQNRSKLRTDGRKYFGAVGLELLRFAVLLSRKLNCDGCLVLDASPDYVVWYGQLGFTKLEVEPIPFNGVEYTPMVLSSDAAARLITRNPQAGKTGVVK